MIFESVFWCSQQCNAICSSNDPVAMLACGMR
jgi:hypothetical protein